MSIEILRENQFEQADGRKTLFIRTAFGLIDKAIDELAYVSKKLARSFLPAISLHISIIVILLMTMIQTAQASGTVAISTGYRPNFNINAPVSQTPDAVCKSFYAKYYAVFLSAGYWQCYTDLGYSYARVDTVSVCPANSTGTTTCTCNDNYQPDSAAKSCVPASDCPITGLTTDTVNVPNGLEALIKKYDKTEEEGALTRKLEDKFNAYSLLSQNTKSAEQCLAGRVAGELLQSDSDYKVTATVRTIAYQAHLRSVWDKFFELKNALKDDPAIRQMCPALISKVEGEMGFRLTQKPTRKKEPCEVPGRNHCIRSIPADPNKDPKHTDKLAFDISETAISTFENILLPPRSMVTEANACNLIWGGTFTPIDRVHFVCCVK